MHIENLKNIIGARLETKPVINELTGFCFDLSSIKLGNVYFASNKENLERAIEKGAYGIVYDFDYEFTNTELAFFKVESLNKAFLKLARYFILERELKLIKLNFIQGKIFKHFNLGKNAFYMTELSRDSLSKLMKLDNSSFLFFAENSFISSLKLEFDYIKIQSKEDKNINSLFFCDNLSFLPSIQFPNIFCQDLNRICEFLDENDISFKIKNLEDFPHFRAVFINSNFQKVAFGSSNRALICENDEKLFILEAMFLSEFDKSAKICLPKNNKIIDINNLTLFSQEENHINPKNIFYFDKLKEIKKLKDFRYALVFCDIEDLDEITQKNTIINNLFE